MKKINYILLVIICINLITISIIVFSKRKSDINQNSSHTNPATTKTNETPSSMTVPLLQIPQNKVLNNNYYVKQTFNNCGPASYSMLLSYYRITASQQELGQILRPFQNPVGDNDDKSVTIEEIEKHAKTYGLHTYHRPNGDIELLKKFITYDIPILTRTWLQINEDIGHYRVIKGFNDTTQTIIQDDSYTGANLSFSYSDFNTMWEKFDYEYLVLVPKEKKEIAEKIIGENINEKVAWKKTASRNIEKLKSNPDDIYSRFNLSVAYFYLKEYQKSVDEFEKVENLIPFRTLWYQLEPVEAYFMLGNYDKVFTITNNIIYRYNRAYSEVYIIRGKIYKIKGGKTLARTEFEKAVFYNENLSDAKVELNSL